MVGEIYANSRQIFKPFRDNPIDKITFASHLFFRILKITLIHLQAYTRNLIRILIHKYNQR
jgi:hypothetical protein